jgi:hypothetical protein
MLVEGVGGLSGLFGDRYHQGAAVVLDAEAERFADAVAAPDGVVEFKRDFGRKGVFKHGGHGGSVAEQALGRIRQTLQRFKTDLVTRQLRFGGGRRVSFARPVGLHAAPARAVGAGDLVDVRQLKRVAAFADRNIGAEREDPRRFAGLEQERRRELGPDGKPTVRGNRGRRARGRQVLPKQSLIDLAAEPQEGSARALRVRNSRQLLADGLERAGRFVVAGDAGRLTSHVCLGAGFESLNRSKLLADGFKFVFFCVNRLQMRHRIGSDTGSGQNRAVLRFERGNLREKLSFRHHFPLFPQDSPAPLTQR